MELQSLSGLGIRDSALGAGVSPFFSNPKQAYATVYMPKKAFSETLGFSGVFGCFGFVVGVSSAGFEV